MNSTLQTLLIKLMRDIADRIECGNCTMSNEELMSAFQTLELYDMTSLLSKDLACSFLNMSRSSFDEKVRYGLIPRGLKVRGFKELFWKKSDLISYEIEKLNSPIK